MGLFDKSSYEPVVATVARLEEDTKLLSLVSSLVLVGIVGLFDKSLYDPEVATDAKLDESTLFESAVVIEFWDIISVVEVPVVCKTLGRLKLTLLFVSGVSSEPLMLTP